MTPAAITQDLVVASHTPNHHHLHTVVVLQVVVIAYPPYMSPCPSKTSITIQKAVTHLHLRRCSPPVAAVPNQVMDHHLHQGIAIPTVLLTLQVPVLTEVLEEDQAPFLPNTKVRIAQLALVHPTMLHIMGMDMGSLIITRTCPQITFTVTNYLLPLLIFLPICFPGIRQEEEGTPECLQ